MGTEMSGSHSFNATDIDRGLAAKLARVVQRRTQWQVAMAAGVPPWAVSNHERNRYLPPRWRQRIDEVLGLSPSERIKT